NPPRESAAEGMRVSALRSLQHAKLSKTAHSVIETDLLNDFAVLELQYCGARKVHLATGRSGKRSHQEITERRTRMSAAAFPLTDDVVTFGDQIGSAPEIQVRKRFAKIRHEGLDVISPPARLVQ